MKIIPLNEEHFFSIEPIKNRVRLVVFKNEVEKVCRKESIKKLVRFIQSDENQLFKGRLQLLKEENGIAVVVKGMVLGKIGRNAFLQCTEAAKMGI